MITETPSLPEGIKQAYDEGKLVVFIGAGISRLAGCQSWDNLATSLVNNCFSPAEASLINGATLSSKERITIAFERAKEAGKLEEYWDTFKNAITPRMNEGISVYEVIARLKTLFITTNCDGLMEKYVPASAWSTQCEPKRLDSLITPFIFYLHGRFVDGSEAEKEGLVFTVGSYLQAYKDSKRLSFLRSIFTSKTVLFIGYGLSEFELLDYLFEKSGSTALRQHYILEGFYGYQAPLYNAKDSYYKSIGVELIPYSKDRLGYDQQIPILSNWVKELLSKSFYNADIISNLRQCLQEYNEKNAEYVKHYILSIPDHKNVYLKAALEYIPGTKNQFDWIKFLWEEKVVTASDYPAVIIRDEKEYPQSWDFLTCLHCILSASNLNNDEALVINTILHDIVDEAYAHSEKVTNVAAYMQLADVVMCLSPNLIDEFWLQFLLEYLSVGHFYAVNSFSERIDRLSKWPKRKINRVLKGIYSIDIAKGIGLYSVEEFTKKILAKTPSLAETIIKECFSLLKAEKTTFIHFEDIESRLERDNDSLSRVVINCLLLCFDKLNSSTIATTVSSLAKKAGSYLQIQFVFYIAKKYLVSSSFFHLFRINPLQYTCTRGDLYYYLECNIQRRIIMSENDLDLFCSWIRGATFGYKPERMKQSEEHRNYIYECINSYKIQFIELLESDYPFVHNQLEEMRQKPFHKEIHPKEHARKSFAFTFEERKTHFVKGELDGLCGDAAFMLTKKKLDNDRDIWSRWGRVEVYSELIDAVAGEDRLSEVLDYLVKQSFEDITDFTSALSTYKEFEKLTGEALWGLIEKLNGILFSETASENRDICLGNYIRILEKAQIHNWRSRDILELCLKTDTQLLWPIHSELQPDYDIITAIINENESIFYGLVIDLLCKHSEDEHLSLIGKTYLSEKLCSNPSIWVRLAACLRIQSLYYLDEDWCEEMLDTILLGDQSLLPLTILTVCSSTNYVIQSLSKYICRRDIFLHVIEAFPQEDGSHNTAERVIQYVTSAYAFCHISWEEYRELINLLPPSSYNYLVHSTLMDKNGHLCETPEETLCKVCNTIRGRSDTTLAKSIFTFIRSISCPSDEIWSLIGWSIDYLPKEPYSWHELSSAFSKLSDPYLPGMKATVMKAINHFDQPFLPWLKKTLSIFAKPERIDDLKELCNAVMDRSFYPTEITEFLRESYSTLVEG